jgi:hypothetical protein
LTFTVADAVIDPAWAVIALVPAPRAITLPSKTLATLEFALLQATPSRARPGAAVPLLIVPDRINVPVSPTVRVRLEGETIKVAKVTGAGWSVNSRNALCALIWSLARCLRRVAQDPVVLPIFVL